MQPRGQSDPGDRVTQGQCELGDSATQGTVLTWCHVDDVWLIREPLPAHNSHNTVTVRLGHVYGSYGVCTGVWHVREWDRDENHADLIVQLTQV